jgi:hypothetical protein
MDRPELSAAVREAEHGNSCRLTLDLVQLAQQDMLTRGGLLDQALSDARDINQQHRDTKESHLAPPTHPLPVLEFSADHPSEFRWGAHKLFLYGYEPKNPTSPRIFVQIDRDAGTMETECQVNNKIQTSKTSFSYAEPIKHL